MFGWVTTSSLVVAPPMPEGDAELVLSKEFWSCWSFWSSLAGTRSRRCYFEKIKCSKQAYALNTLALNNVLGLWSSSSSKTIKHRPGLNHNQCQLYDNSLC